MSLFSIITYSLVAIFGLAVLGKLSGKMKDQYIKWGYPIWFMYALAAGEGLAIAGLFTQYAQYAVYFLLAIMAGAFYTHISHKEPFSKYTLAIVATALLIAYLITKS